MILVNEFAAVEVAVETTPAGTRLQITDLGSGQAATLEAAAIFRAGIPDRAGAVGAVPLVELDQAANGPRLKVTDPGCGRVVFLDPLELADAAGTGVWGALPAAYGGRLTPD